MSRNLAPILRWLVEVQDQPSSLRPIKYSQCVTIILIFSLLEQQRCERIWLSLNLVQGSFYRNSFLLQCQLRSYSSTLLLLFSKNWVYIIVSLISKSTAFSLINLQQLIPFTIAICYSNSESLCLPPEGEVGCLHISATTATMVLLPRSSLMRSLCPSLCRGQSFLITWFIRHIQRITHFQN